jgi:2-polyprenyl-6-methoxyphenol hydroxylase-like FAD-dependent oxidoreductase
MIGLGSCGPRLDLIGDNNMPNALRTLIVGGGIAGMSAGIELAKRGHEVHLIDLDPEWRSYGAGITVQAPMFRALRVLGLSDEVAAAGFPCRGARTRLADGTVLGEVQAEKLEPGLPDGGGIMRPLLHAILAKKTRDLGVNVRLGVTTKDIHEGRDGVHASFTDGSDGTFDAVIGADGIFSKLRCTLFPDAPTPRFTGQAAFRTLAPRPPDLDVIDVYLGNPIKAGVTPVSREQLYMFTLSPEKGDGFMSPQQQVERLREVLAGFGGLIGEIRDTLGPQSPIVYRPLQTLLLPKPWHRGRFVLIGDAVHATTPQLASGAGAAVEDGVLLADYLTNSKSIEEALVGFVERRFDRCRHIVESSVRLGELELAGAPGIEQGRVYSEALARLALPA